MFVQFTENRDKTQRLEIFYTAQARNRVLPHLAGMEVFWRSVRCLGRCPSTERGTEYTPRNQTPLNVHRLQTSCASGVPASTKRFNHPPDQKLAARTLILSPPGLMTKSVNILMYSGKTSTASKSPCTWLSALACLLCGQSTTRRPRSPLCPWNCSTAAAGSTQAPSATLNLGFTMFDNGLCLTAVFARICFRRGFFQKKS